ncbi:hypothetical protein [Flaviaesturariibacter aridisoli]|uniref:DUF3108 domain-containing protein n=1 Tax=Flaviaesturariibacter aridisoli TaxID=2545761 RepID=A0A4R4DYF5_9BACT|nr:hypothetical protein [Flaviaesturariibacter aridisoli]TCZ70488.1 hypothetical protein E0486_11065 [Flaviaesturariibacter aridisoli]
MKRIFFFWMTLLSFAAGAQEVTGLYTGTLRNDSTGLVQQYELSLQQRGEKVEGYAYTSFLLNDRFHFGFRKVRGDVKEGLILRLHEDEMLENNFPAPPPKGIRRMLVVELINGIDSLKGKWSTNRTRQWAPATGTFALKRKRDSTSSALVAKLREHYPPPAAKAEPPRPLAFTERQVQTIQNVTLRADSVEIALYDNGLVDGDSVSVYLNGQPLVQHVRLSEHAFRYTVRLKPGVVNELSLMAENLGSLPPNTGLLVLQSGSARYQVYFSADLKTNARILIQKPN